MTFDPFAKGSNWEKYMANQMQKAGASALEEQCLRAILKTFDIASEWNRLRSHHYTNTGASSPILACLPAVYPNFPITLFARRVLGLANLNLGDFIDEKKFTKAFWYRVFQDNAELYSDSEAVLGMVFGPGPVGCKKLIVTQNFYTTSTVALHQGLRLIYQANAKSDGLLVLETFDTFLRELKTRWSPAT